MKLRIAGATAAAERVRAARVGKRDQALVDPPDRLVMTVGREPKVALVIRGVTPLAARGANLDAVLDCLEAAGLSHFCVRGRSDTAAAVAVREADREAVLAALTAVRRGARLRDPVTANSPVPEESLPGYEPAAWPRSRPPVFPPDLVPQRRTRPPGPGHRYGCDIEFWSEEDGRLVAPRPGKLAEDIRRTPRRCRPPRRF